MDHAIKIRHPRNRFCALRVRDGRAPGDVLCLLKAPLIGVRASEPDA
jgi:hypothetical protein